MKPRREASTITNIVVLWTLIFKYRSIGYWKISFTTLVYLMSSLIETLRANGIVPSDPVPKILGKRANDEDTDVMDFNEKEVRDEKRVKELCMSGSIDVFMRFLGQ